MSTPPPSTPSAPDGEDLRGLARGMRQLLELAVRTLSADAGPSGLVLRVTGHLDCELTEMNSEHQALTRSLLGAGAEGPAREAARRPGPGRGARPSATGHPA